MKQTLGVMVVLGLVAAAPARAALVDFTDSAWDGQSFLDYGSLRVHLSATGGATTTSTFDGNAGSAACLTLACDLDGIGIGDDEISYGGEVLRVSFTDLAGAPVLVDVNGVHLLDLFQFIEGVDPKPETALWRYSSGGTDSLTGIAMGAGTGWAFTAVDVSGVSWIEFYAQKPLSKKNSDFALAGLDVDLTTADTSAVPEPATLALLGSGLLAMGMRRRSR